MLTSDLHRTVMFSPLVVVTGSTKLSPLLTVTVQVYSPPSSPASKGLITRVLSYTVPLGVAVCCRSVTLVAGDMREESELPFLIQPMATAKDTFTVSPITAVQVSVREVPGSSGTLALMSATTETDGEGTTKLRKMQRGYVYYIHHHTQWVWSNGVVPGHPYF